MCGRPPTTPCSPRLIVASQTRFYMKRATSGTETSWASFLCRLVREGFTLATARLNVSRRCHRTVKRCRARVARLRRLKNVFRHSHGTCLTSVRHSQGPKCKGSATRAIATKAGRRDGIARRLFWAPFTARSTPPDPPYRPTVARVPRTRSTICTQVLPIDISKGQTDLSPETTDKGDCD